MNTILFVFPGNELLGDELTKKLTCEKGEFILHTFPDNESYVRVLSQIEHKHCILLCTLNSPDKKMMPLFFLANTLKQLGAEKITLIAPYLSYMRQDKAFNVGEAITSDYFGAFISSFIDHIITVDPHLHRRKSLSEVYSIQNSVLHTAPLISKWIKENVEHPIIIGPDIESEQWVSEVAKNAGAPFTVLTKQRLGDNNVKISIPNIDQYFISHTPILVDDIISTARTMIETVIHLKNIGMLKPICIGVHGLFAQNAYNDLQKAGALKIVTSNSIQHETNGIDVADLIVSELENQFLNSSR